MAFWLIVKKSLNSVLSSMASFFLNDKKLLLFLFFLTISSGFWLLNALRKSYITDLSYAIEFYNLPTDKSIGAEAPTLIKLRVKGTGYILLRYYLGKDFYPLLFDVAHMKRSNLGNKTKVIMEQRQLLALIRMQLSNDIELLEVAPTMLEVWFQNKASKKVPIVFNGKLAYNQPYHLSGKIELMPDSVTISGVDAIVDSITDIQTQFQSFEGIQDSLTKTVLLNIPNNIQISHTQTNVLIPVEAFTEASVDIPISVVGAQKGVIFKTFPADIKVSFRIGLSRFESINSNNFTAVIDVSDVDFATQKKLKVRLERLPDYIYAVDYSPLFVDYLIETHLQQ
jgi:hypothetical protein